MIALLLLLITPAAAYAHASPVRSTPAAGEVLASAPAEVVIEFSEEVEPRSTHLQLFDAGGVIVPTDLPVIDEATPKIVRLALPALADGAYGVHWRVQSQVDGHVTSGSVNFAIGDEITSVSILPPAGTPPLTWQWPAVSDVIQRWLSLIGMACAFGSLLFLLLIWQPLMRSSSEGSATASWLRCVVRFVWVGALLMAVGSLWYLLGQANESALATSIPLSESMGQLLASHIGRVILARLALILVLVIAAGRLASDRASDSLGGADLTGWVTLAISAGVLLTYSMQSHAAAVAAWLMAVDFVHLLAMAAWLGGLLVLLSLLLRREAEAKLPWGSLMQRFSNLALTCVLLLIMTGFSLANRHVRTVDALTETAYGWLLMGKTLLFLLIFIAAAINLLLLVPRVRRGVSTAVKSLPNTIRFELVVGVVLLGTVGALTATAPAFETLQAQQRQGLYYHTEQDQVDLTLRIAPGFPGVNEFAVDLVDYRDPTSTVPTQVLLRYSHQEHDMGVQEFELLPVDGVRYAAHGSYLTMSGPWQIEVIVRRSGFNDVRSQVEFVMPSAETK
ncbi:MAG: copper resistance protein CopC/CopD [Caldilineaceae bacterium]|nr:copper resistance protein CopC/CopD [Caldilineaceae bacterium]